MTDIDFEEQLKQEELAKEKESQGSLTRVEDDGSVMEWDSTRRAWFPKVDYACFLHICRLMSLKSDKKLHMIDKQFTTYQK